MTTSIRGGWRRVLWAALLSLCQPGLGQVYAGKWRLGVVLYLIGLAGIILLIPITRIVAPTPVAVAIFMVGKVALGLILLGSASDLSRLFRRIE